jgi:hypothetical protein
MGSMNRNVARTTTMGFYNRTASLKSHAHAAGIATRYPVGIIDGNLDAVASGSPVRDPLHAGRVGTPEL